MESSKVILNDEDNSGTPEDVLQGITGFKGVTQRGPFDDPSKILTTETDFRRVFGNESDTNPFPALVLRHIRKGGKARVSRVGHYTDVNDKATITALAPALVAIKDGANNALTIFDIVPTRRGTDYNNLKAEIKAATNGVASSFNLLLYIITDKAVTLETYENLTIPVGSTVVNQKWAKAINAGSQLAKITYKDLSAQAGQLRPALAISAFAGGTNGDAAVPVDYIGSASAGTGFHSFDEYDDMFQICTPAIYDGDINNGGALYADGRKDLFFFAHLNPNVTDEDDLIAQREEITVDTKYVGIFSGGLVLADLEEGGENSTIEISEVADVALIATRNDEENAPWISFANYVRGYVNDAKGVVKNFGSAGSVGRLDKLAARQINVMVNKGGRTYLKGNFTGQLSESKASYLHIVRMLIYLRKILGPILEKYLEDPTDIETFRMIWHEVKPILDAVKTRRGLYNYIWDGDQNASRIEDVKINNLADLDRGKYRIKLRLEPINGLGVITVDISLNRAGSLSIELEENI